MTATIKELSYIGIEASDLDAWSGYLGHLLGAMPAREEENIRTFRLDEYVHRHIITKGPKNDISFAGYDCGSDTDLDEVVVLLRAKGHDVTEGDEALCAERGVRRLFWTLDPEGIRVELISGLQRAAQPYANDLNRHGFLTQQGGAGHMFLLCSPGGMGKMLDFYGDLGFKISDHIKEEVAPEVFLDATFTHCNGRHHTLAFAETPAPFKLHHFLIENNSREDVGWAWDRITKAEVPIMLTLGMHSNDEMFSFYSHSPSGVGVEFGWGGVIIDDDTWEVAQYDSISKWGHSSPKELSKYLLAGAAKAEQMERSALDDAVSAASDAGQGIR